MPQLDTTPEYVLGQIHQTVNILVIIEDATKDRKQIIKDVKAEMNRLDNIYRSFGLKGNEDVSTDK